MNIETIAWQRGTSGAASGTYNSFKLYMGLCASDELGATFDDNYIPGSRVLVYETPSQTMAADPDQWATITLDTPYWYNGTDNLIVEIQWTGGANMFYTYWWETGANRSVIAEVASAPSGTVGTSMTELQGTGSLGLEADTFGHIKFTLGQ